MSSLGFGFLISRLVWGEQVWGYFTGAPCPSCLPHWVWPVDPLLLDRAWLFTRGCPEDRSVGISELAHRLPFICARRKAIRDLAQLLLLSLSLSLSATKKEMLTSGEGKKNNTCKTFPSLGEFTLKFVPDRVISKLALNGVSKM